VKRCIAALVLTLIAFPTTALAMPDDLRAPDQKVPSSSLGVPPDLRAPDQQTPRADPSHLPATGTDVAAPDQQASTGAPAATPEPSDGGFDWTYAGIGAAGAASLLAISLAGGIAVRRRQQRHPSALAG
jgi:hypothetical protein